MPKYIGGHNNKFHHLLIHNDYYIIINIHGLSVNKHDREKKLLKIQHHKPFI